MSIDNTISSMNLSPIIQGGMGVGISGWRLARTVSMLKQRGTLTGVALGRVMAFKLQRGDIGGQLKRALSHFPFPDISYRVFNRHFVEGGIPAGAPFKGVPAWGIDPPRSIIELEICANFADVWLAKEGHDGPVGINYLTEIHMPHIFAIYGAMLAGIDWITMGAGIPRQIPGVLEAFTQGKAAEYHVPVIGANIRSYAMRFDPEAFFGKKLILGKPEFYPIVSSNLLAKALANRSPTKGNLDGFIVEEDTAGGHNAPPRKAVYGEDHMPLPIYGPEDDIDYSEIKDLGLPFWIGGSCASPEKLVWAISQGAVGIQVGTAFAFCEESGMDPDIRREARRLAFRNELVIRTDMRISPTGFPFKVACLPGTLSESNVYKARTRVCDQGALVKLCEGPDGAILRRCPAEPLESFIAKGGDPKDAAGRGCICNALLRTAGFGNPEEPAIITCGDGAHEAVVRLMENETSAYSAADVIERLYPRKAAGPLPQ